MGDKTTNSNYLGEDMYMHLYMYNIWKCRHTHTQLRVIADKIWLFSVNIEHWPYLRSELKILTHIYCTILQLVHPINLPYEGFLKQGYPKSSKFEGIS